MTNSTQEIQILKEKLEKRIEQGRENSKSALVRIERDGNLLNDFVANVGMNKAINFIPEDDKVVMRIQNGQDHSYTLHKNAISQLGQRFDISGAYLNQLNDSNEQWATKLAAHVLNEHSMHTTRQRVLLREIDGEIRGVMSDSYRRLNTSEIYSHFLSGVKNTGLEVYSAYAGDLTSYIEAITPYMIEIPTEEKVSLQMAFGVRISNSDFGKKSLELRSFQLQVVCLNGLVRDSILRQVHLGSKLPENIQLSERTYKLDTQTSASAVKDLIGSMFNRSAIEKEAMTIQKAATKEISYDAEFVKLNKVGVQKEEVKEIQDVLIANRKQDGVIGSGQTLWKLAQGISAVARNKADERMRDLQQIAGSLLNNIK